MGRPKNNKRWLAAHRSDPYVRQSRAHNYRSRAAYKLLQLQERDKLLKPGMTVLDLGAAPGGWSQIATQLVQPAGRVIAIDTLPVKPIKGVIFIQGDAHSIPVHDCLQQTLNNTHADFIISDMAPALSGHASIDQPQALALAELALDFAQSFLRCGGGLLIKVFHGECCELFRQKVQCRFETTDMRKPKASRSQSAEAYLVARGYTYNLNPANGRTSG